MNRWNIRSIYLFSHDGRRRDINLNTSSLNIITGAAGTGKSALIKIVDYCLGSSKCEIPQYIVDRCMAVGVDWCLNDIRLHTARAVPAPTRQSSNRMFVRYGRKISYPKDGRELQGSMNPTDGRILIERVFGIGDMEQERRREQETPARISIRHITPYLFLPGSILLSDSSILHGMDDRRKAEGIERSIEYFLKIVDEESLTIEARIRQLRYALEYAHAREAAAERYNEQSEEEAKRLYSEARQVGLIEERLLPNSLKKTLDPPQDSVISLLRRLLTWRPEKAPIVEEDTMSAAYSRRDKLTSELRNLEKQRRAAKRLADEADGYTETVDQQARRLSLVTFFEGQSIDPSCPVCGSDVAGIEETLSLVRQSYDRLQDQGATSRNRTAPKLRSVSEEYDKKIRNLRRSIQEIEREISGLVGESEEASRIQDQNERAARMVGRISYFLDTLEERHTEITEPESRAIALELEGLQSQWSPEFKEHERLTVEAQLSETMTAMLKHLPVEVPLDNGRVYLSIKNMKVFVEDSDRRRIEFSGVGSDGNYMALHVVLVMALQRMFGRRDSPVPGVIFIDQLSRPYFPQQGYTDEITIDSEAKDEETLALKRHIDFLFSEVDESNSLQIILIEHAYFAQDKNYVRSVKERWTESNKVKLVPEDWPIHSDLRG